MTTYTFAGSLTCVSILTGLCTEALKKVLDEKEKTYASNTLAGIIAVVVGALTSVCYALLTSTEFTIIYLVYSLILIALSWLCAMLGYDKVIQTLSQINTTGDEE